MKEFELIRSRRKTLAIEIKGGRVLVKAPLLASNRTIEEFVLRHSDWINKHLEINAERKRALDRIAPLSDAELSALKKSAKEYIPQRASLYADKMGVKYRRISIRAQKTKWGSCSSAGNLNFNCLLMLTPPEVIDSVVVHELCHLKEMNHSKRFYALLEQHYPEYKQCRKWLKENTATIMARLEK